MKSFTVGQALYGTFSKNTAAANLALGAQVANDKYREICGVKDWPWLTRQRTLLTVASTQFVPLPYDCDQVREVAVIISTLTYTPRHCPDQKTWDRLNLSTFTSDIPQWWFTIGGQLGLWPKPTNSNNNIIVTQKNRVVDLSAADYTAGTISQISNAMSTVTGSGTSWGSGMVGRFIKITPTDAGGGGDGVWYEIANVVSATSLQLVRNYGGVSISTGSANYIIGQMPLLPENFQDLPWKAAAAVYWGKELDKRASFYQNQYDTGLALLGQTWTSPDADMVIDDGGSEDIINPNLTISL